MGIIDTVIPEPEGGAHVDPLSMSLTLKEVLVKELQALLGFSINELLERRYQKFRNLGQYTSVDSSVAEDVPKQVANGGANA